MKQTQVDTWSTREQLALASAVLSSGDQNWVAVSRAIRLISSEGQRPGDWYSTKNCALQYAGLLEGVAPSKRKRDRLSGQSSDSTNASDTPGEMLSKMLSKQHLSELSSLISDERILYSQLRKELQQLEAGQIDQQLTVLWEQMVQEEKDELSHQQRYDAWEKEREEAILAIQQAVKGARGGVGVGRKAAGSVVSPSATPTTATIPKVDSSTGSSPLLSSLLTRPPSVAQTPSSVVQKLFSDGGTPQTNSGSVPAIKEQNDSPIAADKTPTLPIIKKSNDSTLSDAGAEPFTSLSTTIIAADDKGCLSNGALVKLERLDHKSGKTERVDADVIKEDTMIFADRPDKASESSSQPGTIKEGYQATVSPKQEPKGVWDDMKSCGEVLQLGEVQRKYSRPKYDYSKDRKQSIKMEKDSDQEDLEPDETYEEEDEEDGGFAGFGPSSMSIGSKKIGSVIGTPKVVEMEDVYNIDNDDTIGIEATKKQQRLLQHTSKCSIDSDDGAGVVKTEPLSSPAHHSSHAPPLVLEYLPADPKRQNKKGNKTDDRAIDFDDCDSVDSLITSRSSACDSDQASSRGVKRRQADLCPQSPHAASPSPVHFSDASPDSPASLGDDPEAEKALRLWRKSVMLLWNEIAAHKYASVFLRPITQDKVPGYHSVVLRPMDLQTIKRQVEGGLVRTIEEFQRDIMLMCTNAIVYNTVAHNVHHMATQLMQDALAKIEEFQSAAGVVAPESPHKALRRETRESLAKRIDDAALITRLVKKKKRNN